MMYELTYLIHPQSDYKNAAEETKEFTEKLGCKIMEPTHSPFPTTLKRLSYPIEHQISAYYHTLRFESEGEVIAKLEKELIFNKNILRYLVVKIPKETMENRKLAEKVVSKKPSDTSKKSMEKNKVKIEEFDKKLDEILDKDII